MNKNWFFLLLIIPLIGYWHFFKQSDYPTVNISEPITGPIEINAGPTPKQIKKISCWVFNYPIKQKEVIDLNNQKTIVLKNGLKQPIICDALIENQWWPIHWSLPIKNLEGNGFTTKAISFDQAIVNVNSWLVNSNNQTVLATSDSLNKEIHKPVAVRGNYRFKQLKSQKIINEFPLCEGNCPKQNKNNNLFFLEVLELPNEKNIGSAIMSSWYDVPFYHACGEVLGITSEQILSNTGLKISDYRLKPFSWDPAFKDGWKTEDAIALINWDDCTFNQASLQWQCQNYSANKEVPHLINKGENCSITNNLLVKEQCQYDYFASKIFNEATTCVDRTLINLGGKTAKIDVNFPTAKGLNIIQRAVALTENSLSMQRDINLIKPIFENNKLIPCQVNLGFSGVMLKISDDKLIFYLEIKSSVNDHKPECKSANKGLNHLHTIFIGEKE